MVHYPRWLLSIGFKTITTMNLLDINSRIM